MVVIMISARDLFEDDMLDKRRFLKVISRNGISDILFALERSPRRFSQLMFETKLNPGILDRHLKALMELKIVEKNEETYELTDTGRRLISILRQLFVSIK
ncbi:MAG: ArsR family transcriptional regulator [Archaeoglobus sp.]|nr:ArsR family transcriptional regulator [Archaeoglobus sp.]